MAWYNENWQYRKKITITGQTGASTNYQIKLLIGESSGATGEDFDLGSNSEDFPSAKNDGGDLRFTDSDETTLLDFWVESVTGATPNRLATVWVKVTDDLGSNQDIYCYYGNSSSPASGSNGDDTFILFDDFDGDSLDTDKWATSDNGGGARSFSGSVMTQSTTSGGQRKIKPQSNSFGKISYEGLHKTDGTRRSFEVSGIEKDASNQIQIFYDAFYKDNKDGWLATALIAGSWQANVLLESRSTGDSVWRVITNNNKDTNGNLGVYDVNRVSKGTTSYAVNLGSSVALSFLGGRYIDANTTLETDWVFIRKIISTEPAFNTAGSEEENTKNTTDFFQFIN